MTYHAITAYVTGTTAKQPLSLSTPTVDLTIDSSSESSIGSNNGRQGTRNSTTTGKRQRFQCD